MKDTLLQYYSRKLKVGEKAMLRTAHLFSLGYWSSYSETECDVIAINAKAIELRNSRYPDTRYTVKNKDLVSGFHGFTF